MVALSMAGLGVANALAPYVGLQLKSISPWWPFVLSAAALALLALGMVAAERSLAGQAPAAAPGTAAAAAPGAWRGGLLPGGVRGGRAGLPVAPVGVQCAAAAAPRHARAELPALMPVFWVGFNLCLLPASLMCKRLGAASVMAMGAELAMLAVAGAALAPGLPLLVAAQLAAGAGWALLLCAAFSGALALGHTGREGLMNGSLQATLAAGGAGAHRHRHHHRAGAGAGGRHGLVAGRGLPGVRGAAGAQRAAALTAAARCRRVTAAMRVPPRRWPGSR
jgi:hypothetical protein